MTFGRDRALHAYTFMCNKLVKFFNSRFGRIHLSLFTSHLSPYIYRVRTQKDKLNFFTVFFWSIQNKCLILQREFLIRYLREEPCSQRRANL